MPETLYVISVAAQLAGMHPQTLRQYDRMGLVCPQRTPGRGRRYTMRDIRTLRRVQQMSQDEGINLEGIKRILELEEQLERAHSMLRHIAQAEAARARSRHRVFTADMSGRVYEAASGRQVRVERLLLPPAPSA